MSVSTLYEYTPPEWAKELNAPSHRLRLAHLPTPILPWPVPCSGSRNFKFFIKRDDLSGLEMSGNKIRKLDFLLAEALKQGCDTVITIGGVQSNHARSTAVAARMVGLEPHLILRTGGSLEDPGCAGNLLMEKMVGSQLHLVTVTDYKRIGSDNLVSHLQSQLSAVGRRPYPIPVGGSNALGTWGYLEAIEELAKQIQSELASSGGITDIIFACGSGGTAAGIALGAHLSGMQVKVHGVIVCDSAQWFHNHINHILADLGVRKDIRSEDIIHLAEGYLGPGYALNTEEELRFVMAVSRATGVLLDPVYSGKAARGMIDMCEHQPELFKGENILFIHTGGLLSLYGKTAEMEKLFDKQEVKVMEVGGL